MSTGSAIFKVIASLVWGIGSVFIMYSMKVDGAQGGWGGLILALGFFGLLQSFSFVSFIMSAFNRGATESVDAVEEKIWVDRFGRVVHRETDAGSGCFAALFLWGLGILLTLLASAVLSPVIFVINLCRAVHYFAPRLIPAVKLRTIVVVALDLAILGGVVGGTIWGFQIADHAIQEREAKQRVESARRVREMEEQNAQMRAEQQARQERARQEQEARNLQYQQEQAARQAEQQRRNAELQAQRERRRQEQEARNLQRQQERAARQAELQRRNAEQQALRERKRLEMEARRRAEEQQRALRNAARQMERMRNGTRRGTRKPAKTPFGL